MLHRRRPRGCRLRPPTEAAPRASPRPRLPTAPNASPTPWPIDVESAASAANSSTGWRDHICTFDDACWFCEMYGVETHHSPRTGVLLRGPGPPRIRSGTIFRGCTSCQVTACGDLEYESTSIHLAKSTTSSGLGGSCDIRDLPLSPSVHTCQRNQSRGLRRGD